MNEIRERVCAATDASWPCMQARSESGEYDIMEKTHCYCTPTVDVSCPCLQATSGPDQGHVNMRLRQKYSDAAAVVLALSIPVEMELGLIEL